MATPMNHLLEVFVSPYDHPAAAATDFFMTDLGRWKNVYVFPPSRLISRVLRRLLEFNCHGVFVAPWRPLQP